MIDLDTRIRDAIGQVASAEEPTQSPDDVIRRLESEARPSGWRVGARTLALVAIVLLVLGVTTVVMVRRGVSDGSQAPVDVGPGPTTVSPTLTPGLIPAGWHDWGSPDRLATMSYVLPVPVGTQVAVVGAKGPAVPDGNLVAEVLDVTTGMWRSIPDPGLAGSGVPFAGGGLAIGDRAAFWNGTAIALLDPTTDTWTRGAAAPKDVVGTAVWTGTELVFVERGLRYRPDTDQWSTLPVVPEGVNWSAAWDGHEIIAASGVMMAVADVAQAYAMDPATDTWRRLADPPLAGNALDLTWDGQRVVGVDYALGAATYDPATDEWTALSDLPIEGGECSVFVRTMGASVFAQGCWGAAVLTAGGAWQDVTDGHEGQLPATIGRGVATWRGDRGSFTSPTPVIGAKGSLWTYGP